MRKSVLSSAAADAARRISYIEVFINLTMLIKSEDSFFFNRELMRVSVVRGWVLIRHLLTFLKIPICCACTSKGKGKVLPRTGHEGAEGE